MAVEAIGSKYSRNTNLLLVGLGLAFGVYFLYDGWMAEKYQRQHLTWYFQAEDITDPSGLAQEIKNPDSPYSKFVRGAITPASLKIIDKHAGTQPAPEELKAILLQELNSLLPALAFYDRQVFAGYSFSPETQEFIDIAEFREQEVIIRNRLILTEIFPDYLRKGDWRKEGEPDVNLMVNRVYGPVGCLLMALFFLFKYVQLGKLRVVADDQGVVVNGQQTIAYSDIKQIDKRYFDKEGYFVVEYTSGGATKSVKLSDRQYDHLSAVLDEIIKRTGVAGQAQAAPTEPTGNGDATDKTTD